MNGKTGISGQKLAYLVVGALALTIVLFSFCLFTYQRLSAIRSERDACWRPLADLLDLRYRRIEVLVARGVDGSQIDMRWGEKWRSALDQFRAVSGSVEQESAAQEVEELLLKLHEAVTDSVLMGELVRAISISEENSPKFAPVCSDYRQAVDRERWLLTSIGGRMIDTFLRIEVPTEFNIAGITDASKS